MTQHGFNWPIWQIVSFPRTAALVLIVLLASVLSAGCAKIAEPQPPEVRIPLPAVDLAARQLSDFVVLTVSKPEGNTGGSQPADLKTVDVYRMEEDSAARAGMPDSEFIQQSLRVVSIGSPRLSEYLNGGRFTFQDRSVSMSRTYWYAVLFINKKNRSAGLSNRVSITPVPIPPPPSKINAEGTQGSIRLKWTPPSENLDGSTPPRIAGYNIYRSEDPKRFPPSPINVEPVTSAEFEDSNFKFDDTYHYAITAIGSLRHPYPESLLSNPVSHTARDTFPPEPPADFSAIAQGDAIFLLWSPSPSADLAGYRLYRREKGETERRLVEPELIRGISFRDAGADAAKQYEYEIQAVDGHGNSRLPVRTEPE